MMDMARQSDVIFVLFWMDIDGTRIHCNGMLVRLLVPRQARCVIITLFKGCWHKVLDMSLNRNFKDSRGK